VEAHGIRPRNADLAASFAVPMLAQIPSTPLHILSLDLYSRRRCVAGGVWGVWSGSVDGLATND
jgi:hypothetical protein